jgi:O-antigen ligase
VSFSRSAWLGLVVAIIASVLLLGNKLIRVVTVAVVSIGVVALFVSSSMLPQYLQDTKLQYFLLHGRYNQSQQIEGSDVGRNSAQQKAIATIASEPWGHGLGTAGPASFRAAQPFITESWYLQIGLELGVLGVGLFLAFFVTNGFMLARLTSPLSLALASSIVGLLVTNLFLHAWADSTLGIMLFVLMGLLANERPTKEKG